MIGDMFMAKAKPVNYSNWNNMSKLISISKKMLITIYWRFLIQICLKEKTAYNISKMENQKNLKIVIFASLVLASVSVSLSVSVNDPFLLSAMSNISTVDPDIGNSFLVGLQDGQARRYSSDFSSFTALAVPEPVDQFSSWSIQLNNILLSNGTLWTMLCSMTVALSRSFTTLTAYTYPAFAPLQSFSFAEPILDYRGLPVAPPPAIAPFHILVFNQTIKIIYKSAVSTAFDLVSTFGANSFCAAVAFNQWALGYGGDFINITYNYFEAVTGVGLVQISLSLSFRYNFSSLSYDMTLGSTHQFLSSLSSAIASMVMANGVLLLQARSGGLLLHYGGVTGVVPFVDPNISIRPVLNFIFYGGSYYILFSAGLVLANLRATTAQYFGSVLVSSLPNNTYRLTGGSVLNVLYVPFGPYIYKASCFGQSYDNGFGSCSLYSCALANCRDCKLTVNTCGVCDSGFVRNEALTCSIQAAPTNSTSNSTASSTTNAAMNSTASNATTDYSTSSTTTNSSTNDTSWPSYSTNSMAYSTTNSTPPDTNNSTFDNQTNYTMDGYSSEQQLFFYVVFPILIDLPWLQDFFWLFFNASKAVISVPSMRRLAPLFYYFGNFDDLYLYKFHDRLYGPTMNDLFAEISTIERQKWAVLDYGTGLSWLGVRKESFYSQAGFQEDYLTYAYNVSGRQDQESEGLLVNCANFFVVALPLTMVGFLLLRGCFRLLFRFPVSRLLRKFDLWGYFFIIIFDGNVQQFAFYLAAEWRSAFAFSFGDSCLKVGVYLFGFILVLASVGGFLVSFGTYKRLNRHLTDNNYNNLKGNAYLLLQCGFRNFLLGILHSILRPLPYTAMLLTLITTELFFFTVLVASIALRTYRTMNAIWLYILLSFIRIILICTLSFDYSLTGNFLIETIQCTIIFIMILTYCMGTFIAILIAIVQFIKSIISIIREGSHSKQRLLETEIHDRTMITIKHLQGARYKKVTFNKTESDGKKALPRARMVNTTNCLNRKTMRIVDVNVEIVRGYRTKRTI